MLLGKAAGSWSLSFSAPRGFPSHPSALLTQHRGWCHPGHHGAPGPASEPISVGAGSAEVAARGTGVPAAIGGIAAGCHPPSRVRTSASTRKGERRRVQGSQGWESTGTDSARGQRGLCFPQKWRHFHLSQRKAWAAPCKI